MKLVKKLLFIPFLTLVVGCGNFNSSSKENSSTGSSSIYVPIDIDDPSTYWDNTQEDLREGRATLDFYNFNDFHGALDYNPDSSEAGMVKLSTYINAKRQQNPDGFVLTNSGDMWQGSASSNLTKGELTIEWLNYLGCSAQALGNHEFDWGLDLIKENNPKQNFPTLACNIMHEDTKQIEEEWVTPFTTKTVNGVRVGIIGAIGEGLTSTITARHVKGLEFVDPTPYVNSWADHLRENGADVILYLIHDSIDAVDSSTLSKVDAVFGGHTHSYEEVNSPIPMIQSSSNGKALGHINLVYDFEESEVVSARGENLNTKSNAISTLPDDQGAQEIYDFYNENYIEAEKNRVVGNHKGGISKGEAPYVFNTYAYKYFKEEIDTNDEYDIWGIESNNARADINSLANGDITYGSVYSAFPFDNSLVLIRISGQNIVNGLASYGSAKFTLLGEGTVNRKDLGNYCEPDEYYYLLVINYITDNEYTSQYIEIIEEYNEVDALPRNIVARYLSGYPNNLAI